MWDRLAGMAEALEGLMEGLMEGLLEGLLWVLKNVIRAT